MSRIFKFSNWQIFKSKKLLLHPQQPNQSTGMYCQYTATRFKVAFPRQVINSIQHFPGINRLYQYPGIGNKLFDEADELVISFGISAKIIFSVQLVCGRGG